MCQLSIDLFTTTADPITPWPLDHFNAGPPSFWTPISHKLHPNGTPYLWVWSPKTLQPHLNILLLIWSRITCFIVSQWLFMYSSVCTYTEIIIERKKKKKKVPHISIPGWWHCTASYGQGCSFIPLLWRSIQDFNIWKAKWVITKATSNNQPFVIWYNWHLRLWSRHCWIWMGPSS